MKNPASLISIVRPLILNQFKRTLYGLCTMALLAMNPLAGATGEWMTAGHQERTPVSLPSFASTPNQTYVGSNLTVPITANASSALPVPLSTIHGPTLVTGSILTSAGTGTNTGTVAAVANRVGDAAYDSAPSFCRSAFALPPSGTFMAFGYQGRMPASLHGITAVVAGWSHTVALKSDGEVVAWGFNGNGETTIPAGLSGVTAMAAGSYHTAALKSDGTVVAWGNNSYGQTTSPAGLSGVTNIAAGADHTVALKSDGAVVAWGYNNSGQTTIPAGLSGVIAIAAGAYHTVALKSDGTVVAWGNNAQGQRTIPAGLSGVIAIAAGGTHTVALKNDGTVVAWGNNAWGQRTIPAGLGGVVAIAAGGSHTVALKSDGTVVAWGDNGFGQTVIPAGLSDVTAMAAGGSHTVALKRDGTVVAWGNNGSGQTTSPAGLSAVTAIAVGGSHTVARKSNGTVVAWGSNGSGQITIPAGLSGVTAIAAGANHTVALQSDETVVAWGDNTSGQTTIPAGLSGVAAIAAGGSHTVARKSDGTVAAWGGNFFGQTTIPAGLSGVIAIAAGSSHTVALKNDGTVAAWGDNHFGQTAIPAGLSGVIAIATGNTHTVALKNDGTVVAWGNNGNGQATIPVGLSGVMAIAAGQLHTAALKSDGTVVAWGNNGSRQTTIPAGMSGVTAIAAGGDQTWAFLPVRPTNAVTIAGTATLVGGAFTTPPVTTANGRTPTSTTFNGSYAMPSMPGTYTVVATADYLDSYGTATGSLTVNGLTQTISFTAIGHQTFGVAPIALTATASSGLPPTFSVVSGPANVTGSTLTITGAGTVVLAADQAGNNTYSAALQVRQSITVAKASQTISGFAAFGTHAYGDVPFMINGVTGGASGQAVMFTSDTPSVATVSGRTVTITGSGVAVITANQAGDANYTAATSAPQTLTVGKATQTIAFAVVGDQTFGASPITLTATASSMLTPLFLVVSGPATVDGSTLTITGVGTVVVAANQMGNANYFPAAQVTQTITVTSASGSDAGDTDSSSSGGKCGMGSNLAFVLACCLLAFGLRIKTMDLIDRERHQDQFQGKTQNG